MILQMEAELKTKILNDLKDAMRSGDEAKKNVLRLINAAIKNEEVNARVDARKGVISDADVLMLIRREIKQHQESLEEAKAASRDDLVREQQIELDILNTYLPQQMTREQIAEAVKQAMTETGATHAKQMGVLMKALMPRVQGKADGKLVQEVVKQLLAQ
jgi:uncharacterized protein YqeY